MLQRSSLPTTSPAEIADSLQRTLDGPFAGRRWQALHDVVPMPATWTQYVIACLAIAVVAGGMWLQVLLSVEIARAELALRQLRSDYAAIERQNSGLIYAIAQQSSLAHMAELATQNGYVPATGRTYVLRGQPAAGLPPAAAAPASSGFNPVPTPNRLEPAPSWLDQTRQWWLQLQQAANTAAGQLWRDVTGRMK